MPWCYIVHIVIREYNSRYYFDISLELLVVPVLVSSIPLLYCLMTYFIAVCLEWCNICSQVQGWTGQHHYDPLPSIPSEGLPEEGAFQVAMEHFSLAVMGRCVGSCAGEKVPYLLSQVQHGVPVYLRSDCHYVCCLHMSSVDNVGVNDKLTCCFAFLSPPGH